MQARILLAERELARTRAFTDQWRENAPREARIAHVFVDITRRAEDASVEIVRFEPLPPERLALLNRIPVDMACEGNYWQLFAFLASLEALSADFWIPDLKIEPVTLDQNRLRCELKLAIFADQREISD